MQADTVLISLNHAPISADSRYGPKLYPRIVGNDRLMTVCSFETFPEFFGPWHALEVGIGTAESACSDPKLMDTGVNPSRMRIHMIW